MGREMAVVLVGKNLSHSYKLAHPHLFKIPIHKRNDCVPPNYRTNYVDQSTNQQEFQHASYS